MPQLHATSGYVASPLPGLGVVRHTAPTPLEASVYEPVLCLILRGRKRTFSGPAQVDFGPGESLIVSHAIPVVSQVTVSPYLALILSLDVELVRSIDEEIAAGPARRTTGSALALGATDARVLEALGRYVSLAGDASEARILGPLVLKELHFRLCQATHGGTLHDLAREHSVASRIREAVGTIRSSFRVGVSVRDLARVAGMSDSTFFRNFKAVTGNTPLQYLKEMRLLEARRLLSTRGYNVTQAAFEVGYASPTQFSREYSRRFSVPPSVHAQAS
ncbi:MAG: AraC family transcriptional regulator [Gemmatimonadetes bacterium]|nr:AraC family transcriptional regulator [Gemmatimonadota bacterium]